MITEREMLAWLHERGSVEIMSYQNYATARLLRLVTGTDEGVGDDLEQALERLVVAVAAREAKACTCDLRTKLAGDGCHVCNPEANA